MITMALERESLSRVVAVANGKGGVGKTSIATTLAGITAAADYRTLLIDLDPQGNAGEDFGYRRTDQDDDGHGLYAALATGTPLAITIPNVRERVDVISGGEHLIELGAVLTSRLSRQLPISNALASPLAELLDRTDYDLVIIDCPPGEENLQLMALGAARWVIIPSRGDTASLSGMAKIAQRMVQVRDTNPDLEILGVALFGIPNSATRIKRQVTDETAEVLGGVAPLFEATIRNSMSALDARHDGQLIHEFATKMEGEPFWKALRAGKRPSSSGSAPALAGDYAALSHEILTRIHRLEQQGADAEQAVGQ